MPFMQWSIIFARHRSSRKTSRKNRKQKRTGPRRDDFHRWLSMLPKRLRFNELAPAHIQLYIDERLREIKASSINREVTCLGSAIHSAHVNFPDSSDFSDPENSAPESRAITPRTPHYAGRSDESPDASFVSTTRRRKRN
ncbi:MAG: hypothetical protein JWN60_2261 [Acidobacteria bacterium]|nr:hypothetical protein [Acidobacteriota bacterium]